MPDDSSPLLSRVPQRRSHPCSIIAPTSGPLPQVTLTTLPSRATFGARPRRLRAACNRRAAEPAPTGRTHAAYHHTIPSDQAPEPAWNRAALPQPCSRDPCCSRAARRCCWQCRPLPSQRPALRFPARPSVSTLSRRACGSSPARPMREAVSPSPASHPAATPSTWPTSPRSKLPCVSVCASATAVAGREPLVGCPNRFGQPQERTRLTRSTRPGVDSWWRPPTLARTVRGAGPASRASGSISFRWGCWFQSDRSARASWRQVDPQQGGPWPRTMANRFRCRDQRAGSDRSAAGGTGGDLHTRFAQHGSIAGGRLRRATISARPITAGRTNPL